jgi:ADP-ribosylglycohydrolase
MSEDGRTRSSTATERRTRLAFSGCLLGGAVGDALGAPIEFMRLEEIRRRFGREGVTDLVAGRWPTGSVTDDTQMTLFTAEAMIRGVHRHRNRGIAAAAGAARRAYLRWLHTQGERVPEDVLDGWLVTVPALRARRAPGNTCLTALIAGGPGTTESPVSESKGCGTVMRIAPVGLALPDSAFRAGCEVAAITHGHPTGWLAAGYLAQVVAWLADGRDLRDAAVAALAPLAQVRGHEETTAAVRSALSLTDGGEPSPEKVESLGGGWVAEEALAIALYCALVARDFAHGVLLAVNHGGDSDSTGAIAGNLLGLVHGEQAIPARWLERLELREVIARVADDLWAHFGRAQVRRCDDVDRERYPGT